ncbi:MAG: radical SAM protein [Myxococcota bacterium]|jgi:radical SAM protein with 4Fe4S-binding SPASM domain|nr:radical SAM protein [Myxococcota bacterium]
MPTYTPKNCVFEATLACNLRCQHCGSRAGKARGDELSTAESLRVFEELAGIGCERVTISGGEPTMRPDWLELIAGAKKAGMRVGLITNALLWNVENAKAARDAGLAAVGFSLDGLREVHDRVRGKVGHFEHIIRAMDASVAAGLPWASVTFINSLNLRQLGDMYELLANHGAFAWQVQLGSDMGNLREHPDLHLDKRSLPALESILADIVRRGRMRVDIADSIGYYGQHEVALRSSVHNGRKKAAFGGCGAGVRVIGIESNGNVKGCLSIMAGYNEEGKDYVEGNVRQRPLADIWNDPNAFAYNRKWSIEQLRGFCQQCKHATVCRGGCLGKRVASGQLGEYTQCLYRIACEDAPAHHKVGHAAAAALLAGTLVGLGTGCPESDDPNPKPTDTTTDTSTDAQPEYGIPDTDTNVEKYGMPDTSTDPQTEYGIPDTDTNVDTNVEKYGMPDTNTDPQPEYGISDTDTNVLEYGSPEPPDPDLP